MLREFLKKKKKSIRFLGSCPVIFIVCVLFIPRYTQSAIKCEYVGTDVLFMSRRIEIAEKFGIE